MVNILPIIGKMLNCSQGPTRTVKQPYDSIAPTSVWDYWSCGLGNLASLRHPDYVRVFPRLSPFADLRINLDLLPRSFSSYLLGPRSWSSPLVAQTGLEPVADYSAFTLPPLCYMYVFALSPERTNCADTRFGGRSAH